MCNKRADTQVCPYNIIKKARMKKGCILSFSQSAPTTLLKRHSAVPVSKFQRLNRVWVLHRNSDSRTGMPLQYRRHSDLRFPKCRGGPMCPSSTTLRQKYPGFDF